MPKRCAAALAFAVTLSSIYAQKNAGEWPTYNRDLAGTRYSPLAQINTKNVARLTRAWSYALGFDASSTGITGGSEFTPIVVKSEVVATVGELTRIPIYAERGATVPVGQLGESFKAIELWHTYVH